MSPSISKLFSTVAAICLCASAHALTTYSDADYFGGLTPVLSTPNGQTVGSGQSINGTFNFVAADGTSGFSIGLPYGIFDWDSYTSALGFTPGAESVVPGSAFLKFFIREGILDFEVFTFSLADISFQSTVFSTAFALSSGVTATVEGAINASGEVAYSISSNSGSFIVDAAYMEISTQRVPDGGASVLLLGSALLGIAAIRSKIFPA